jgi:hypothetical protein
VVEVENTRGFTRDALQAVVLPWIGDEGSVLDIQFHDDSTMLVVCSNGARRLTHASVATVTTLLAQPGNRFSVSFGRLWCCSDGVSVYRPAAVAQALLLRSRHEKLRFSVVSKKTLLNHTGMKLTSSTASDADASPAVFVCPMSTTVHRGDSPAHPAGSEHGRCETAYCGCVGRHVHRAEGATGAEDKAGREASGRCQPHAVAPQRRSRWSRDC